MIYAPGADGRQTQIGRVALPQVIDLSPDFAPIRPPPERTSS